VRKRGFRLQREDFLYHNPSDFFNLRCHHYNTYRCPFTLAFKRDFAGACYRIVREEKAHHHVMGVDGEVWRWPLRLNEVFTVRRSEKNN
jgi:hypothetical protein